MSSRNLYYWIINTTNAVFAEQPISLVIQKVIDPGLIKPSARTTTSSQVIQTSLKLFTQWKCYSKPFNMTGMIALS